MDSVLFGVWSSSIKGFRASFMLIPKMYLSLGGHTDLIESNEIYIVKTLIIAVTGRGGP
jgi:hypothetical protein